jgi:hypothetical protein
MTDMSERSKKEDRGYKSNHRVIYQAALPPNVTAEKPSKALQNSPGKFTCQLKITREMKAACENPFGNSNAM